MKTFKAFLFLSLTFFSGYSFAQSVEGRVTLSEEPKYKKPMRTALADKSAEILNLAVSYV